MRQIDGEVDRVAAELWRITNDELAAIQAALHERKRPRGGRNRSDNLSLGLDDEVEQPSVQSMAEWDRHIFACFGARILAPIVRPAGKLGGVQRIAPNAPCFSKLFTSVHRRRRRRRSRRHVRRHRRRSRRRHVRRRRHFARFSVELR